MPSLTSDATQMIEARDVRKAFGHVQVLRGVSLSVQEGSIVALLGHLRAGQAEVIRMVKLEGRSIKEAADLSGQSESLVKVNIHRGILAMRAMLGGDLAFA